MKNARTALRHAIGDSIIYTTVLAATLCAANCSSLQAQDGLAFENDTAEVAIVGKLSQTTSAMIASRISLADGNAMKGGMIESDSIVGTGIRQQSMLSVVESGHLAQDSGRQDTGHGNQAPSVDMSQQFDVSEILGAISSDSSLQPDEIEELDSPWWRAHAEKQMNPEHRAVPAGVNDLIRMTLENSAQIQVYQKTPQIRETAVTQAASAFDWTQFLDATWNDINEPVGSSLTVGGNGDRFNDHNFLFNVGGRKKLTNGGMLETYQRLGHQNTNSQFFVPNDQGTARLVLGYTQPLMRGRGEAYNTSLILLAKIDVRRAQDEYQRQLQQHLLEVARGYWSLYLERAKLAQKISLYLKTQVNVDHLTQRQAVDAQRTQLIQATAALESRRSDLIRAKAAVSNAETRLRALINAPYLSDTTEILPIDHPVLHQVQPVLYDEFSIAMRNRPEIRGALKEIRAACVRQSMAQHEMLPVLNLVTNTYLAGLQGDSRVGDAWLDQFRDGAPSYSAGVEWELPVGRRAASANVRRRHLERVQLGERYRATLELVRAEVEVAVREVNTSYQELSAKNRARHAAEAEAETLEIRWKSLGGRDNNAGLALEALLQSQERVALSEQELAQAQLTYSLSLINLRHANGSLLQMDTGIETSVSDIPAVDQELPQEPVRNQVLEAEPQFEVRQPISTHEVTKAPPVTKPQTKTEFAPVRVARPNITIER
ncbi:MAG: TolC family protein [Pirellulaceae bacterium]